MPFTSLNNVEFFIDYSNKDSINVKGAFKQKAWQSLNRNELRLNTHNYNTHDYVQSPNFALSSNPIFAPDGRTDG